MARLATNFPEKGASGVFENRNCIDCDPCRQIAPQFFSAEHPGDSGEYFQRQPAAVQEYLARFDAVRTSLAEEIDFDSTGLDYGFEDFI